jgi:hypothetical protein
MVQGIRRCFLVLLASSLLGGCESGNSSIGGGHNTVAGARGGSNTPDALLHGQPWRDPNDRSALSAPAGAHLAYHGGRVVSNVQIVQVLYGTGSYLPQVSSIASPSMATFYQGVTNSPFVDWLIEYNTTTQSGMHSNQVIGRGHFVTQVQISPSATNNGSTIDDSNIQSELAAQIQAGHLPAPTSDAAGNNNTYYAIFFPHGKTITQGGSSSCVGGGFCAYHGTIGSVGNFGEVYYGVHPDMQAGSGCDSGCGTGTPFGNYTSVASHEMTETITDPEIGIAQSIAAPIAWYDPTNGEIGDICNAQQGSIVGSDGVTYTVQKEFSNVANDCIVSRAVANNDFSISANPTTVTVTQGQSGTTTISTAITSGNTQTVSLTLSGLPSGASATFNPTSVNAGGSSTLSLNSGTAAAGTYALTVTGTGTSTTHTASVSFVVRAPTANDFSISANPSSVSAAQGGTATSTIATMVTSGSAQSVSLSASGTPAGTTATFNPASVTAGNSATLTLAVGASTAPGTYTITVTGTGTSATHTTSVSLTVTATGGGGIVNGGFETGDFTGWTTSGATSISMTAHTGRFSAMVGSTGAFNGDSSVAQTFTVPSGVSTLSFFYQVHCMDTVRFDWATATLKDNTTGTTTTVLPHTCTNNNTWVQATTNVTAGHSVTLTLIDHDDNFSNPPDPTFTFYDDVAFGSGGGVTNPFTNPGFENGLTGWTTAGATSSSTTAHTGAASAMVGSMNAFNGDSSIAQTVTIPAGATTLTFWFEVVCTDTVQFDWATATLTDNTSNTTTTILAHTCTNAGTFVQASAAVTAGHSVTLTLIDHDDNFSSPPDPTFTLYDDVSVQ